ncbi:MAG: hypothetical protein IJB81_02805 [Clostridia bacterium]|nr:hypothetical protein [Clostridia bacterium]
MLRNHAALPPLAFIHGSLIVTSHEGRPLFASFTWHAGAFPAACVAKKPVIQQIFAFLQGKEVRCLRLACDIRKIGCRIAKVGENVRNF